MYLAKAGCLVMFLAISCAGCSALKKRKEPVDLTQSPKTKIAIDGQEVSRDVLDRIVAQKKNTSASEPNAADSANSPGFLKTGLEQNRANSLPTTSFQTSEAVNTGSLSASNGIDFLPETSGSDSGSKTFKSQSDAPVKLSRKSGEWSSGSNLSQVSHASFQKLDTTDETTRRVQTRKSGFVVNLPPVNDTQSAANQVKLRHVESLPRQKIQANATNPIEAIPRTATTNSSHNRSFELAGVMRDSNNVACAILKIDGSTSQVVKPGSEILHENNGRIEKYLVEAIHDAAIQLRNTETNQQKLVK